MPIDGNVVATHTCSGKERRLGKYANLHLGANYDARDESKSITYVMKVHAHAPAQ